MSDDLDVLRAAWTADSGLEGEVERSRLLWKRAVRRMWFWNFIDSAVLLLVAAHLVTSVLGNATWQALSLTAVIVAILAWYLRKSYLLRNAELGSPDTERVSVLGSEIRRVRARLVRNALSLAIILPMFALGLLLGRMQKSAGSAPTGLKAVGPAWLDSAVVRWVAVLILVLLVAKLVQVVLRDRRDLRQLRSRVEEYRAEYERDSEETP